MALLKGEGTHQILYGSADIFSGLHHNRGYLARPDHAGSFPSVLLVHDSDGITSSVKSVARRLARHGIAAVVPDLYEGLDPATVPWSDEAAALDLLDTLQWMASLDTPWVQPGGVGVVALGRGGPVAARFAHEHQGVVGLALIAPTHDEELVSPALPAIGFYGRDDEVVGAEDRQTVQARIGHAEWVLYGGAGHGLVDEAAADYRWEVAEDVIERVVGFLGSVLEP
ncbi:MAG: dienelactone hydrolase family protein [Acidimicrobiia bacterium]